MRRSTLIATLVLGGALGCEAEAPVPEKPTWAADVQPILRANCFHCHGATATGDHGLFRFDVFDLSDPTYAELGFAREGAFWSANSATIAPSLGATAEDTKEEARMPPPPAARLTDREVQILKKWNDSGREKGSHNPNHKPTISWLSKRQYVVADADGDQVLGKLTCGSMTVQIPSSGAGTLPSGASSPCTGTLYDGFEKANVK